MRYVTTEQYNAIIDALNEAQKLRAKPREGKHLSLAAKIALQREAKEWEEKARTIGGTN